jgi:hypothetical protein
MLYNVIEIVLFVSLVYFHLIFFSFPSKIALPLDPASILTDFSQQKMPILAGSLGDTVLYDTCKYTMGLLFHLKLPLTKCFALFRDKLSSAIIISIDSWNWMERVCYC